MPLDPIDILFSKIKQNYKKYLEAHMVSQMEAIRKENPERIQVIEQYVDEIKEFRKAEESYLNKLLTNQSLASQVGDGAWAALAGAGVGGAAYWLHQRYTPNIVNLVPGLNLANQTVGGFFSAGLGLSTGYLIYEALKSTHPTLANDTEALKKALDKAGFNDPKKYNELVADLVKLFHYRECLLLGLINDDKINMRQKFKEDFYKDKSVNDKELDIAIEAYFTQQLNELFNKAFKKIYDIQDQEIIDDRNANEILKWLKSYFSDPAKREVFTEQLQIKFMDQCVTYLEDKKNEPGFFAKHKISAAAFLTSGSGLVTVSVALIILFSVGASVTFGLTIAISLAILVAVVVGFGFFSFGKTDKFKYKRDRANREGIEKTIKNIEKEKTRLEGLIEQVVATSKEDMSNLTKFNKMGGEAKGFLERLRSYFDVKKEPAIGSMTAWLNEYATRYRHSKLIENDLGSEVKEIIKKSDEQTKKFTKMLHDAMSFVSPRREKAREHLQHVIKDTIEYLQLDSSKSKDTSKGFVDSFHIINKIKQQFLEIAAGIPLTDSAGNRMLPFPQEFVEFYTNVLQGSAQDLENVRSLAPMFLADASGKPPLQNLLTQASYLDTKLQEIAPGKLILQGDSDYRKMLGLREMSIKEKQAYEKTISADIDSYLHDSFEFLLSLSSTSMFPNRQEILDNPLQNEQTYTLYQTLLFKELATLVDPNNLQIDSSIRTKIINFIKVKFKLSDEEVKNRFDAITNQSFFFDPKSEEGKLLNPVHIEVSLSGLNHIADAIRVNMASIPLLTPKMLIDKEIADLFLDSDQKDALLFDKNKCSHLRPSQDASYVEYVTNVIKNSRCLIERISKIQPTGILNNYLATALDNIALLMLSIQSMDSPLPPVYDMKGALVPPPPAKVESINNPYLKEVYKSLHEYKECLDAQLRELLEHALTTPLDESYLSSSWIFVNPDDPRQSIITGLNNLKANLPKYKLFSFSRDKLSPELIDGIIKAIEEYFDQSSEELQSQLKKEQFVNYIQGIQTKYKAVAPELFHLLEHLKIILPQVDLLSTHQKVDPQGLGEAGDEFTSISSILFGGGDSSGPDPSSLPSPSDNMPDYLGFSSVILVPPISVDENLKQFKDALNSCIDVLNEPKKGWVPSFFYSNPDNKDQIERGVRLVEILEGDKSSTITLGDFNKLIQDILAPGSGKIYDLVKTNLSYLDKFGSGLSSNELSP